MNCPLLNATANASASERSRRAGDVVGDVYQILRSLGASDEIIEGLAEITGGKQIWHPELMGLRRKTERRERRQAVREDPSGDMKDVARRHGVALSTVYFWKNQAG